MTNLTHSKEVDISCRFSFRHFNETPYNCYSRQETELEMFSSVFNTILFLLSQKTDPASPATTLGCPLPQVVSRTARTTAAHWRTHPWTSETGRRRTARRVWGHLTAAGAVEAMPGTTTARRAAACSPT